MAHNRSALNSSVAVALRQRFADREAGSIESLARTGRARLHQKMAALPIGVVRHSFMLPLVSSLAGLAVLAAAFSFMPRHADTPVMTVATVAPVQTAANITPALLSPPQTPAAPAITTPLTVTQPIFAPRSAHRAPRTLLSASLAPAPAVTIISVPPSLQAATDAGAGVGSVEPVVKMAKTSAGIAVTWTAADGEKFIVSKTCFTDHNFTDATTASRILLNSGEWVDTAPDAVGCDQVHYEVRRVA